MSEENKNENVVIGFFAMKILPKRQLTASNSGIGSTSTWNWAKSGRSPKRAMT